MFRKVKLVQVEVPAWVEKQLHTMSEKPLETETELDLGRILSQLPERQRPAVTEAYTAAEAKRVSTLLRMLDQAPAIKRIYQLTPEKHRPVVLEAWKDCKDYTLLQPTKGSPGIARRAEQWQQMGGPKRLVASWMAVGLAAAGAVAGGVIGLSIPEVVGYPLWPLTALVGGIAGFGGARAFVSEGKYTEGMMRVYVNERWSENYPERVTNQAEAWIPKALLAHRQHEWEHKDGKPYLWLMLPSETNLHDVLNGTLSYLDLPADPYIALEDAVQLQRTLVRMNAENAEDFKDYRRAQGENAENGLLKAAPQILPFVEILGGILTLVMLIG